MIRRSRTLGALACLLVALSVAGCGLAETPSSGDVSLLVTTGFGAAKVRSVAKIPERSPQPVAKLPDTHVSIVTSPGGAARVRAVDGRPAQPPQTRWSDFINGVAAPLGPVPTKVHPGDRVWWDLHAGEAAASVPAVVGAFPEPFVHGIAGKRYPTTLECAGNVGSACDTVSAAFSGAGVTAATQQFGTGSGTDSLNVLVATWSTLRAALVADVIARGPGVSGVYARFVLGGRGLALLDPSGRVVRTLGAGAGLVAATADISGTPTWLVTGTDPAGVAAAARALSASRLHDHFALAVQGNQSFPLPVAPGT